MTNWTKNNYCHYGFDGKPFTLRTDPEERYFEYFGPAEREPKSYYEESLEAAKLIAESANNKPIALMLSGGGDSEVMAEFFKECNIPFKAMTLRYNGGVNDYDINYAFKWCEKNHIEQEIIDVDTTKLIESDWAKDLSEKFYIQYRYLPVYIWALEHVVSMGYFPVFCEQTITMFIKNQGTNWCMKCYECYSALARYAQLQNYEMCNRFLNYTPEQFLAYLRHPVMQKGFNLDPDYYDIITEDAKEYGSDFHTRVIKQYFFRSLFPRYEIRQRCDGFENIKYKDDKFERIIPDKYRDHHIYYLAYDHLIDELEKNLDTKTPLKIEKFWIDQKVDGKYSPTI